MGLGEINIKSKDAWSLIVCVACVVAWSFYTFQTKSEAALVDSRIQTLEKAASQTSVDVSWIRGYLEKKNAPAER